MAICRRLGILGLQKELFPIHSTNNQKRCKLQLNFNQNYRTVHTAQQPDFGFLFDIDGVIVRGDSILPTARETFKMLLLNEANEFRVPCVFVTNAGNMFRQKKAKLLSKWLDVEVEAEQVVMSHSPLKMFKQFHNKNVLVTGQGPISEIAANLGFKNVTTMDRLRQLFPKLDMVDHKRRKSAVCAFEKYFPRIEAVILFGEPVRWETNLQLIIDLLLTNGKPDAAPREIPYPHIPVLACNMDLLWMAEACMPRFGHGCFLLALETLYKKITGRELKYTAHIGKPSGLTYHHADHQLHIHARSIGLEGIRKIYCIGDNPETDIYGSNLYNRYLHNRNLTKVAKKVAVGNELSNTDVVDSVCETSDFLVDGEYTDIMTEKCESILVCTGVYCTGRDYVTYSEKTSSNHNHRDFVLDHSLKQPTYVTDNILEAVRMVFEKEGFK